MSDSIECIKSFTRQILEGVCYLHQLNPVILHRDIKGGNILMDKTHTCIKLADFGCAKEVLLVRIEMCLTYFILSEWEAVMFIWVCRMGFVQWLQT